MPPLFLPEGVPLGLGWYLLWISIHGLLIFIFRLLAAPDSNFKEEAREETEKRLSSLNEYIFHITQEPVGNPFNGPLTTADDLSKLIIRARNANKPIMMYNRLQKQTALGKFSECVGIIVALICGGLYLLKYPSIEVASLISIAGFGIFMLWALWHIIKSAIYYCLTLRESNDNA